jgi:hypothetical protein
MSHNFGMLKIVMGMKMIKIVRFLIKMKTKVGLILNLDYETKKTRTQHVQNKIQPDFIAKKKPNKVLTRECTQT